MKDELNFFMDIKDISIIGEKDPKWLGKLTLGNLLSSVLGLKMCGNVSCLFFSFMLLKKVILLWRNYEWELKKIRLQSLYIKYKL